MLKVNQIERELTFLGHRRIKRGLLNFLGKGINFITGNMYDRDAEKSSSQEEALELNQDNIAQLSNKLNKYNTRINDKL